MALASLVAISEPKSLDSSNGPRNTYCLGREAAVTAAAEPGLAPGELLRNHGGQAVPAGRLEDQVPFPHAVVSCLLCHMGFKRGCLFRCLRT
jgi:hypothetical protein